MTSSGTIRRVASTSRTGGVFPRRLLGLLVGLGCAVLVLASPAAALPKLPSPITIPTLPKLPAVPTLPGIGGLPIVSQPIDIPLPVPPLPIDVPLPVEVPLPIEVPLPLPPLPVVPSAPLSTSAFPGLDGLPVPLGADGLAAAAAADGEQLAPDGASAGTPAEGFPETPTSGLLRQPGTGANPQGTRCFLATSASVAFAYECLERGASTGAVGDEARRPDDRTSGSRGHLARPHRRGRSRAGRGGRAADGGRRVGATAPPATRRNTRRLTRSSQVARQRIQEAT